MRPNFFVAMLACALLSVLLSACGGGSSSAGSSATNPTPPAAGANNPSPPGSSSNPTPPSGSQPGGGGSAPGTGTPSQGGFAEKKSSIPSSGHLITADFNRDGRPDLLSYGSSLVVLLNNGSGDFGGPISIGIPSPYTGATQVSLADFNSDGYIDVVACLNNDATAGGAAVFLNDHSGKLIPGQVVSAPARCTGVGAADANRDGKSDFAIAYFTGSFSSPNNGITTWFGDGAGHFANSVTQSNVALTATKDPTMNPCSVAAATGTDLSGDGVLDLLLFGTCQSDVINPGDIYLAKGDGTGHYSLIEVTESNTSVTGSPYIKDVNADGVRDVVFLQSQEGPHGSSGTDLDYAVNNGSGSFTITRVAGESAYAGSGSYLLSGSSLSGPNTALEGFSTAGCCADLPDSYGVKLFTQPGASPTQTWIYGQSANAPAGWVRGIASADFDGNGTPDFAVAEEDANHNSTLHVYLNSNR
jgi:hypothetical protein